MYLSVIIDAYLYCALLSVLSYMYFVMIYFRNRLFDKTFYRFIHMICFWNFLDLLSIMFLRVKPFGMLYCDLMYTSIEFFTFSSLLWSVAISRLCYLTVSSGKNRFTKRYYIRTHLIIILSSLAWSLIKTLNTEIYDIVILKTDTGNV